MDFTGDRRHRVGRYRDNGRYEGSGNHFAIRQGPAARFRHMVALRAVGIVGRQAERIGRIRNQLGAGLEDIVIAIQRPHPLGEVGIEMAVENRVTLLGVAVAAVVDHFVGIGRTGADSLGIQVGAAVVIGREQPLLGVQVEYVKLLAHVQVADFGPVADIGVEHVGGVGRIERLGGLWPGDQVAGVVGRIGRDIHQQARVADRPRGQEELLELALRTIPGGTDAQPVGNHLGPDRVRSVVDHEGILDAGQSELEGRIGEDRERLDRLDLVMEDNCKLPEGLVAVRIGRVPGVGAAREITMVRPGDDRVQFVMHNPVFSIGDSQDRLPFETVAGGVNRIIVDHGVLSPQRCPGGRQQQFGIGHAATVPLGPSLLNVQRAEQAEGGLPLESFAADHVGLAGDVIGAFMFAAHGIDECSAGRDQSGRRPADIYPLVGDAVDQRNPLEGHPHRACRGLLIETGHRQRRRSQQVLEVDLQAVAFVDP